jgi:hypothetical protein
MEQGIPLLEGFEYAADLAPGVDCLRTSPSTPFRDRVSFQNDCAEFFQKINRGENYFEPFGKYVLSDDGNHYWSSSFGTCHIYFELFPHSDAFKFKSELLQAACRVKEACVNAHGIGGDERFESSDGKGHGLVCIRDGSRFYDQATIEKYATSVPDSGSTILQLSVRVCKEIRDCWARRIAGLGTAGYLVSYCSGYRRDFCMNNSVAITSSIWALRSVPEDNKKRFIGLCAACCFVTCCSSEIAKSFCQRHDIAITLSYFALTRLAEEFKDCTLPKLPTKWPGKHNGYPGDLQKPSISPEDTQHGTICISPLERSTLCKRSLVHLPPSKSRSLPREHFRACDISAIA